MSELSSRNNCSVNAPHRSRVGVGMKRFARGEV